MQTKVSNKFIMGKAIACYLVEDKGKVGRIYRHGKDYYTCLSISKDGTSILAKTTDLQHFGKLPEMVFIAKEA